MKELEELWIHISERYRREKIKNIILVPKRIRLLFWKIRQRVENDEH